MEASTTESSEFTFFTCYLRAFQYAGYVRSTVSGALAECHSVTPKKMIGCWRWKPQRSLIFPTIVRGSWGPIEREGRRECEKRGESLPSRSWRVFKDDSKVGLVTFLPWIKPPTARLVSYRNYFGVWIGTVGSAGLLKKLKRLRLAKRELRSLF